MKRVSCRVMALAAAAFAILPGVALAQDDGKFFWDASLRNRLDLVDWFEPSGGAVDSSYAMGTLKYQLGAGYEINNLRAYVQGQYSQIIDAPDDGSGIGATYFTSNSNRETTGDAFLREAWLQGSWSLCQDTTLKGTIGRFQYHGGNEVAVEDKGLDWLKKNRIQDRLLGTFDYSFGRSYDGVRLDSVSNSIGTITAAAFRPSYGGYETDGMQQIESINIVTAVWTPALVAETAEIQAFYYYYDDSRDNNVVKTDNRPQDVRAADVEDISIHTFGLHGVKRYDVGRNSIDTLAWAAVQVGDWGEQDHYAAAFALEAGYRFEEVYGKPWIRGGWNYGTGDDDPGDGDHDTFFQMLPTARTYAMTPFYNMMNTSDLFGQVIWQAWDKAVIRSDAHVLWLSQDEDLLYAGGGAGKEDNSFGFIGTASGGEDYVGTLLDIGISFPLHDNLIATLYYGHLFGGDMPEAAFSGGREDIDYGYLELTAKF